MAKYCVYSIENAKDMSLEIFSKKIYKKIERKRVMRVIFWGGSIF